LEVLLVNLLAALNFANVFLNKKRLENKKTLKNVKKTFFTSMITARFTPLWLKLQYFVLLWTCI